MSPVALTSMALPAIDTKARPPALTSIATPSFTSTPCPEPKTPTGIFTDISRRPSPWHEIAHSLSTTSLPPRPIQIQTKTQSQSHSQSRSRSSSLTTSPPLTPADEGLSTSQALREWDARLSHPDSNAFRHQLIHTVPPPIYNHSFSSTQLPSPILGPKLEAERDKHGYIEYKLKLIEPTPERFERLVTQMMWRLKQGKNEAIYELGLADDGTVIGLPRSEMDASLRTLELMASEVGATVIVLKEIVLQSHLTRSKHVHSHNGLLSTQPTLDPFAPPCPQCANGNVANKQTRPGINGNVSPRKWNGDSKNRGRRRYKKKKDYQPAFTADEDHPIRFPVYGGSLPKKMVFAAEDLLAAASREDDTDSDDHRPACDFGLQHGHERGSQKTIIREANVAATTAVGAVGSVKPLGSRKDEKKRRKSAAKSEQRRLDLLRGDGTNPMWAELVSVDGDDTTTAPSKQPVLLPFATMNPTERIDHLSVHHSPDTSRFTTPHQPLRPSSLRLTSPAEQSHDSFVDDLLSTPLDNLSLSFADVRTISPPPPPLPSPPSSLRTFTTKNQNNGVTGELADGCESFALHPVSDVQVEGEEMICVEALVVRKLQHDENVDGADGSDQSCSQLEQEEDWGYGGEEDVWGFGADEDD